MDFREEQREKMMGLAVGFIKRQRDLQWGLGDYIIGTQYKLVD